MKKIDLFQDAEVINEFELIFCIGVFCVVIIHWQMFLYAPQGTMWASSIQLLQFWILVLQINCFLKKIPASIVMLKSIKSLCSEKLWVFRLHIVFILQRVNFDLNWCNKDGTTSLKNIFVSQVLQKLITLKFDVSCSENNDCIVVLHDASLT